MTTIPPRPTLQDDLYDGPSMAEKRDYEHAVAKAAVEALEKLLLAAEDFLYRGAEEPPRYSLKDVAWEANEAMKQIENSGWTP